jgi:TPR repeat protein
MASLTPLSKGLIAVAIVGAMASAVWHLGLKDWLAARNAPPATASTPALPEPQAPAPAPSVEPPPPPVAETKAPAPTSTSVNHAELGRKLLASGDYAQARSHLEQAVQGGDGGAACLLGEMTLKGQGGIPASQDKAASLFQLAQSRGNICFASN